MIRSARRKLLFSLLAIVGSIGITYAILEVIVSLGRKLTITRRQDVVLVEKSSCPLRFCPVFGFRLGEIPSRYCRVIRGKVEVLATMKGNRLGLPDDDFSTTKSAPNKARVLVLGDSFTAATFLEVNWPKRSEQLAGRGEDGSLELLNFSQEGIGLANWWSMLLRHIDQRDYQLSGVLFAIYKGDLRRPFAFQDHSGPVPLLGNSVGFEPASWPRTIDEARRLAWQHGWLVSSEALDRALRGSPPSGNTFRLEITFGLWRSFRTCRRAHLWMADGRFDPSRQRLVTQIAEVLRRRRWPVLVVAIPARDDLIDPESFEEALGEAVAFANQLGASLIDGREAFAGLPPDELRDCFFPNDGHWCQKGSDLFAEFLTPRIEQWLDRLESRVSTPTAQRPLQHVR